MKFDKSKFKNSTKTKIPYIEIDSYSNPEITMVNFFTLTAGSMNIVRYLVSANVHFGYLYFKLVHNCLSLFYFCTKNNYYTIELLT